MRTNDDRGATDIAVADAVAASIVVSYLSNAYFFSPAYPTSYINTHVSLYLYIAIVS